MKNCHVWGKCHLSPKLESEGERLQTSLGADVDIRLMTADRPALNTLRAPYVWATSLLGLRPSVRLPGVVLRLNPNYPHKQHESEWDGDNWNHHMPTQNKNT